MKTTTTTYTVADYCAMMHRGDIRVNRNYQRSDKVWPTTAKAFLVDTILLGYPIPKLSLYQFRDLTNARLYRDIIDGQQRSEAILEFHDGLLRLGKNVETDDARGRTFQQLDPELQQRFLDYPLSVDLFLSASDDEIREVFRRINSYTVPLNPEEQRHAVYQGAFKWFIFELSRKYGQVWLDVGTFSEKNLVRMGDAKLLAEIIHALFHGITTTNKGKLNALYLDKNRDFPEARDCQDRIDAALALILKIPQIHGTSLMLHYQMYPMILAITHLLHPVPKLQSVYEVHKPVKLSVRVAAQNLSRLAELVDGESPTDSDPLYDFHLASADRTNVKAQRETRFKWMCAALLDRMTLANALA